MPEHRECIDCHHQGLDDESRETAACHYCGASQPIDCEDHCPACDHANFMGAACPECDGIYSLVDPTD